MVKVGCFGTYFSHAQSCETVRVPSATEWTASVYSTHAQGCDIVRVPSAMEWTAPIHTLHMPKAVITLLFKLLRKGPLRYILYTCPKLLLSSELMSV